KAGVAKDVEHRPVVAEGCRKESTEACERRLCCQLLEQQRADTFALKSIIDGKRHFGRSFRDAQIRGDGHDTAIVLNVPNSHERKGSTRFRAVAETRDER